MDRVILVVEDDKNLQSFLRELLTENGYIVQTAGDGIPALKMIEKAVPDLVLLDLELPVLKGDAVVAELKKDYPQLPVIILTARDQTNQIVHGLNLGADDYMTKPFDSSELLARVNARLRQSSTTEAILKLADLVMDTQAIQVKRGDKNIILTPQEFKLLEYLMAHPGQVLTREMILGRLWSINSEVETRVVDVYVGYLRKKIDAGFKQKLIHSVRGFGYKIEA